LHVHAAVCCLRTVVSRVLFFHMRLCAETACVYVEHPVLRFFLRIQP
jgi:hypothetical protein